MDSKITPSKSPFGSMSTGIGLWLLGTKSVMMPCPECQGQGAKWEGIHSPASIVKSDSKKVCSVQSGKTQAL